jgi:hypothetical protein
LERMNYLLDKADRKLHKELRTVEERTLFVCMCVGHRTAMEDEEGYCVTTGLAIQYGNKKTEHTADDRAVTSVFSGTLTSQYLYTPLCQGYDK